MPITIDGSGTVTGISAGGLPDGCVTPADLSQPLTLGTSVAATSGTAIDFTGIPSWAKRITVMLNGVSTNTAVNLRLQLGTSAGFASTGYVGSTSALGPMFISSFFSSGFDSTFEDNSAALQRYGTLELFNISGFQWILSGAYANSIVEYDPINWLMNGAVTLSGTLDRIRITTVVSATFDAGNINILYGG